MRDMRQYLVRETQTIKDAMNNIDRSGIQTVFVINAKGVLTGVVSDGDIRRAILKGTDIGEPISKIINNRPITLQNMYLDDLPLARRTVKRLLAILPGSQVIPVIDHNSKPVKLLSCLDLRPFLTDRRPSSPVRHVLVLGGAGYLGSVLVEKLLCKNLRVRVLDTLMFGRQPMDRFRSSKNFELIHGDLRNIATVSGALAGTDAVINLAAVVGDAACSANPENAIETNYLANKALAEACKYHQINRFLFASTCSVYGVGKDILDENSPLRPVSLYARSKIRSEEAVLSLEDKNFSPTILRMSTLYGLSPRMRFDLVVNCMTMTACRDKKIYVDGGGQQWRPFLSVEDAAEAYLRCLEAPIDSIKGQVFNVGSSHQNYQIKTIAKKIKELFKNVAVVYRGPHQDHRNYSVSFKKIRSVLGFRVHSTLERSAREIKKNIGSGKLSDLNNPRYYNVDND